MSSSPTIAAEPITQPDSNGEFDSPLDGALWMAQQWNIVQIPLLPRSKQAFSPDWPSIATTDAEQIRKWFQEHPGCNFGSVARDTHAIFETDTTDVSKRFKAQGGEFTSRLLVVSAKGGHRYYRLPSNLEGISQNATKNGDFSVRIGNAYCCSPGSIHPTGKQYRVIVVPGYPAAPDFPTSAEIKFWQSERKSSAEAKEAFDASKPIPMGQRNSMLTSIAGRYRDMGWDEARILEQLRIDNERCEVPLDEKDLATISRSVARYEDGVTRRLKETPKLGGVPAGSEKIETQAEETLEVDTSDYAARPVFPHWVMEGTSLYEGLAKPHTAANSKYPELIWLPAVQLMLNHLFGKVHIESMPTLKLNLFLGIISPPGEFFKSSSAELAHDYMKYIGLADRWNPAMTTAGDKAIILSASSPEGFGLRISELAATHGLLYNDELAKLTAKAGIENSSFVPDMLSWYESNEFGSSIKNRKQSFSFSAGSYCFGWTFCTTIGAFNRNWSKLGRDTDNSGLQDRMFFVVTPPEPKPLTPETYVPFYEQAAETRKLIDKAVAQRVYPIEEQQYLAEGASSFGGPRAMNLVYKFALYFAVDLGRDVIDLDCIDRALALVQYRQQAVMFLAPIDAENSEGRLQQEMVRLLRQNRGKLSKREFGKKLHAERYGTRLWNQAYEGILKNKTVFEQVLEGNRGQKSTYVLLRKIEE